MFLYYIDTLFPLDISDILYHIKTIVVDWRYLGICLKMQYCVLDEISANNPRDIVACKEQMISRWMSRDSLATPSCWWMLVKAIEMMGRNLIAKQIKKVHGKCYINHRSYYYTSDQHYDTILQYTCMAIVLISELIT